MLAARLLGERQFGLSSLVEKFLGVKLDKGSQKADWARRPLTERMETYARNDTHYLKPLADKLKLELQQKGRLAWHQESCARLIAESSKPSAANADCRLAHQGQPRVESPGAGRFARILGMARKRSHRRQSPAVFHSQPRKTHRPSPRPPPRTSRLTICCRRASRRAAAKV